MSFLDILFSIKRLKGLTVNIFKSINLCLGLSGRSSPRRSPQASINQAFDEEKSEERERFVLRTSSPSTSDTKNGSNRLEMEYIMRTLNENDRNELKDMSYNTTNNRDISQCRHRISGDNTRTPSNSHNNQSTSPKSGEKTVSKTMSSEESLLSGTGSLVIEESASSGGESSPGSGIFKNIIINLGGLPPPDYNDLSQDLASDSGDRHSLPTKINNIDSTGGRTGSKSPDSRPKRY